MKKVKVLSIVLAVVGILALAIGGTVLADDGNDTTPDTCQPGENPGQWGRYPGGFLGSCMDDISELLGLTAEEIRELRVEGQSLADIAASQGVSEAELVAVITTSMTENLAAKVAEGVITQEKADAILEQLPDRVTTMVNQTGPAFGRSEIGEGNKRFQPGRNAENLEEALAERVANGDLTQEQADAILAKMTEMKNRMGDEDGYRAGFRHGFQRGFKADCAAGDDELSAENGKFNRQRGFAPGR